MDIGVFTNGKLLQAWFPFVDESKVLIEYVPRDELLKINAQARKTVFKNHQKVEEFDQALADKLLGLRAVKNWEGFFNHGENFPCTPENIELLMRKWNAFSRLVNDSCDNLEVFAREQKEEISKNS